MFETYKFNNEDMSLDSLERHLLNKLNLRGKILFDFGGGYGRISQYLSDRFSTVYMLEYSIENLKVFRNVIREKNIIPIRGDFLSPPFKAETADCIVSLRTVHHYESPDFIVDWLRLVKSGGRIIFNINNLRNVTLIYDLIKGNGPNPLKGEGVTCAYEDGIRICFHSPSIIKDILRKHGFTDNVKLIEYNYGFLHRKSITEFLAAHGINSSLMQNIIDNGFYSKFLSNFILMEVVKI